MAMDNLNTETGRLHSLYQLKVLDTDQEESFDQLVEIAATISNTPIALISFVDQDRQWFKACFGIDATETPRSQSFCAYAIQTPNQPFVITDATEDSRFAHNELVIGQPGIRFYAGFPIKSPVDGKAIGTICVIDRQPREASSIPTELLEKLANQVEKLLELRYALITERKLRADALTANYAMDHCSDAVFWIQEDGGFRYVNRTACRYLGYQEAELLKMTVSDINPNYPLENWPAHWLETKEKGELEFETFHQRKDGSQYDCHITKSFIELDGDEFIFAIVKDISESRALRREVDRANAELNQIVESMPIAMIYANENREIARVNSAFCEIFQYRPDEVLGLQTKVVYEDYEEFKRQGAARFNKNAQTSLLPYEAGYRRKDGTTFPGETVGTAVQDNDGNILGFLGLVQDISDKKLAESQLQQYKFATDNTTEAVYWVREDSSFFYVNRAACEMLGYAREELLTLGVVDIDPAYPFDVWRAHWQRMKVDRFMTLSSEHFDSDGNVRHVDMEIHFYEFAGEEFVVGTARDVTEKRRAEIQLRKAETALETAADAILWIDTEGHILFANQIACSERQFSRDELIGMSINELAVQTDLQNDFSRELWESLREGFGSSFETIHIRKDGSTFPVEIVTQAIEFAEEKFACSIVRDISERKERLKRLEELTATNQAFIDLLGVSDGVWDWKVGTDEAWFAPGWRKMLGFKGDDGIGFPNKLEAFKSRIHPEDIDRVWREVEKSFQAGVGWVDIDSKLGHAKRPYQCEFRLRNKFGQYIWVRSRGMPSFDLEGKPVRLVGSVYDVTEVKLAQLELQKEKDALARSNEDLERFAYVASHDLQEPLRAVGGFLQLLELKYADQLDETARGYIAKSVAGAERMNRLINDLLYFSRVSRSDADLVPVDLNVAVKAALEKLEHACLKSGAEIKIKRELPTVDGISTLLIQLFQNLFGNAIKYCDQDHPRVSVDFDDVREFHQIAISDNGIGIAKEHFEKIFLIFNRLHRREDYPGTGIGLAICKRIMERHGGDIDVESEVGVGSTFVLRFPAEKRLV